MEVISEPYAGKPLGRQQPLLPVWDFELPLVTGLKAPSSRTRIEGLDEMLACTTCNGTGRALCATCAGRGWIVCPECRGRTKKRCNTCRGRGYIADWAGVEKKPFFKKQADNLAQSVNERVADVFDGIRQQGMPIPNPIDTDPANKGKTVPCPDCVNGEIDCTCGNGKRVCETCQGAKSALCVNCGGTGKVVRHREIERQFELRTQTKIVGESAIPPQRLARAVGDLVYSAEVTEELHPEAAPNGVPLTSGTPPLNLLRRRPPGRISPVTIIYRNRHAPACRCSNWCVSPTQRWRIATRIRTTRSTSMMARVRRSSTPIAILPAGIASSVSFVLSPPT